MRQCEVYKNIIKTEAVLNSVAFGDDGAAYYYTEELNEYKGECIECGKCHFSEVIAYDDKAEDSL